MGLADRTLSQRGVDALYGPVDGGRTVAVHEFDEVDLRRFDGFAGVVEERVPGIEALHRSGIAFAAG
ncbi:hypothetical protein AArcS_3074 [Natranaeroarchaeum sulfidigenes]|uniref:Uncharacterized protein n=1 Tax=Natranaeroarchaeum sulfidigenes TaxID=2784880 RepID=A0A897MVG2_9EURY|nr:hypothetical protein AArcS_3074 [Natranaeroarchaeum sulfidigenes]